jgi:small-conductance mechanosensitive channel
MNDYFNITVWLDTGIGFAGFVVFLLSGWAISFFLLRIAIFLINKQDHQLASSLKKHAYIAVYFLLILLVVNFAYPLVKFPELADLYLRKFLKIFWIIGFSWLIIKLTYVIEDIVYYNYSLDVENNISRRRIRTQFQFIKKIIITIVVIVGFSLVLMSFERMRELGTSLLASAGVAGVIIGFAAQRSIANILAGFQIAFTQPIRIDDVVIVENEWGRIEEINLTYVVVRIWDMRRLVLPITYFIEKPFQNWTRTSADIIGTVFLYLDYTVPLEEVRKELKLILDSTELWDKKVWVLQVTNSTEKSIEVRALMSAKDAPTAWDLRCLVREKLITYIQDKYPDALPKIRAEVGQKSDFVGLG